MATYESPVAQAYQKWVSLSPARHPVEAREVIYFKGDEEIRFIEPAHFSGDCCGMRHFTKDALGNFISMPDSRVCSREKAWRDYVRVRDGVC